MLKLEPKIFFEKVLEFVGIFWWIWFIPSTNSTSLLYRLGPKHTYIFQHETLLYDYAKICTAVIHIRVILSKFSLYWKRIHSCFLFTLWASIIMMRLSFSPSHYGPFMIHIWSPNLFFFDSDPKCPHMKLERNSHNGRFGNGWWEKFNDVDFHAIH